LNTSENGVQIVVFCTLKTLMLGWFHNQMCNKYARFGAAACKLMKSPNDIPEDGIL